MLRTYTNFNISATTSPYIAIASAKAKAKIIAVWTFGAASGFRPIASAALAAILPIDKAGAIVPMPMTMAIANNLIDSASIISL